MTTHKPHTRGFKDVRQYYRDKAKDNKFEDRETLYDFFKGDAIYEDMIDLGFDPTSLASYNNLHRTMEEVVFDEDVVLTLADFKLEDERRTLYLKHPSGFTITLDQAALNILCDRMRR